MGGLIFGTVDGLPPPTKGLREKAGAGAELSNNLTAPLCFWAKLSKLGQTFYVHPDSIDVKLPCSPPNLQI